MEVSLLIARRSLMAFVCAVGLGALVAGCGGGGASSPIPQAPAKNVTAPKQPMIHPVQNISRASIPSVMAKLTRSGAYPSGIKGHPFHPKAVPGRHIMTVSAGMNLANNGGPVVTGASAINILVNGTDESSWGGMIGQFENDLFGDQSGTGMINILDQYLGQSATSAFSDGGDYPVTYNTSSQLGDQDIDNIIYQVATANNISTGYGTIFNVFLQNGVQECSTAAGGCYGQTYCAYHGSNDYSDIGHALYTVEPYQDIQGCQVSNLPSPNGSTADSTASTLSHETFELITDPDVAIGNTAWYNSSGGEIGDLCAPAVGVPTGNVGLGADTWEIQMEYDNNVSDCSYSP